MRMTVDPREVQQMARESWAVWNVARRAVLTNLVVQAEGHAMDLSRGGSEPGDYPIPVRTGRFRGAFGWVVSDDSATLSNEANYSRAIHDGYQPYGNPHARPIPPRPYFTDALARVDVDAAFDAWARHFVNSGGAMQ